MMTDWYQKAIDALQLNGLSERTQEAYVRALRMLCEFYDATPDLISEEQLRQYFLQRKNIDSWSPATMRICYCGIRHALFEASSQVIKTLIADPRSVGADQAGFFGVLHTWGRELQYHPHIHYLVPGGALSFADGAWHPSSRGFLLPVKALSKLFRAKFRASIRALGLEKAIPAETWSAGWNVNSQAVPSAQASIRYLAPQVFEVAISDSRILEVANDRVAFTYRKPASHRLRTLTLAAHEFIRRFLQHVLPTGFMKVRYYGFLSPSAILRIPDLNAKIELAHVFTVTLPDIELPPWPETPCQACGGKLRFHKSLRIVRSAKAAARGVGPPSPALPQPYCN